MSLSPMSMRLDVSEKRSSYFSFGDTRQKVTDYKETIDKIMKTISAQWNNAVKEGKTGVELEFSEFDYATSLVTMEDYQALVVPIIQKKVGKEFDITSYVDWGNENKEKLNSGLVRMLTIKIRYLFGK